MPAHATKTSYITSYMKIEVFDRVEKGSNCVWKDEWGRRREPILFTSVCQRHVLVGELWRAHNGKLDWGWRFYFHARSFLLRLSDSIFSISFFFHPSFFLFPNSNRWKFSPRRSTDHPPPRSSPLLFTSSFPPPFTPPPSPKILSTALSVIRSPRYSSSLARSMIDW